MHILYEQRIIAILATILFVLPTHRGYAAADGASRQLPVWRKKSSLPEAQLLQAIHEYAERGIPALKKSRAHEWKYPVAQELHLIAEARGIQNWPHRYYIFFEGGGQKRSKAEREEFPTDLYKIHLMPTDDTIPAFAYYLSGIIQDDPDLYNAIPAYKFHIHRPTSKSGKPRVVIYLYGKENAQKVLNILYKKLQGIPGSGNRARFSAYVTNLIWVAQGNGDEKLDPMKKNDYEQPYQIYFRPDFTGIVEDYHLKHPQTGADLNAPFERPPLPNYSV
jgi:hypothetical protein